MKKIILLLMLSILNFVDIRSCAMEETGGVRNRYHKKFILNEDGMPEYTTPYVYREFSTIEEEQEDQLFSPLGKPWELFRQRQYEKAFRPLYKLARARNPLACYLVGRYYANDINNLMVGRIYEDPEEAEILSQNPLLIEKMQERFHRSFNRWINIRQKKHDVREIYHPTFIIPTFPEILKLEQDRIQKKLLDRLFTPLGEAWERCRRGEHLSAYMLLELLTTKEKNALDPFYPHACNLLASLPVYLVNNRRALDLNRETILFSKDLFLTQLATDALEHINRVNG